MPAVGGHISLFAEYRGTVVRTAQRLHCQKGRTALGLNGSTAPCVYCVYCLVAGNRKS